MKKLARFAAALLAVGAVAIVHPSAALAQSSVTAPSFTATVYPVPNTSTIRLVVNKELGKRFYFSLRDKQHNVIYFDEMTKRSTQRRFDLNLSELVNGTYYIDLSDGKAPLVTKVISKEQVELARQIVADQVICMN